MSDSEQVWAVHTVTGLVSEVPRIWLGLLPLRELSAKELTDLRAKTTPAPAPEVPDVPVESSTVPAPVEEG